MDSETEEESVPEPVVTEPAVDAGIETPVYVEPIQAKTIADAGRMFGEMIAKMKK